MEQRTIIRIHAELARFAVTIRSHNVPFLFWKTHPDVLERLKTYEEIKGVKAKKHLVKAIRSFYWGKGLKG